MLHGSGRFDSVVAVMCVCFIVLYVHGRVLRYISPWRNIVPVKLGVRAPVLTLSTTAAGLESILLCLQTVNRNLHYSKSHQR